VQVRAATTGDARAIHGIYAPAVEHTVVSFESTPPPVEEMASRMLAGDRRLPWLVGVRAGRLVGYAYAAAHRARAAYRWSVETSVYVADDARGGGVGRRLYDVLLPLLTELGYVNAYAGIALPNDASVGLHEAVGFLPVGTFPRVGFKHGRWHDTGWWWPLAEPAAVPAEPRAWDGRDPA
jgi:L-amino acid N-acyltransferase YncA